VQVQLRLKSVGGDFEAGLCEFCKRVSIDPRKSTFCTWKSWKSHFTTQLYM